MDWLSQTDKANLLSHLLPTHLLPRSIISQAISYPRPPRLRTRPLTQADLIATALQVEEENIESLRIWLEEEEERKRINKIARKVVAGPRISWISRKVGGEKEKKGRERERQEEKRLRKGKGKDEVERNEGEEESGIGVGDGSKQVVDSQQQQQQQQLDRTVGKSNVSLQSPMSIQPFPNLQETIEPSQIPLTTVSISQPTSATTDPPTSHFLLPNHPPTSTSLLQQPLSTSESSPQPPPTTTTTTATTTTTTTTTHPIEPKPTEPLKDQPYERNYLILSSIQGQANELKVLFGDHADWTALERIPIKNRSIRECFFFFSFSSSRQAPLNAQALPS